MNPTIGTIVQTNSSAGTITLSATTSGSNCAILVLIGSRSSSDIITGVTFNGVSMARSQSVTDGGLDRVYSYYLTAVGATTANIVVSQSSTIGMVVVGVPLSGVDQVTMIDTSGTGTTSVTLTTNYSNSLILDIVNSHSSSVAPTTTGSNTRIWTAAIFASTTSAAGSDLTTTTPGMYTTSWSTTGGNNAIVSAAIKAAVTNTSNFLTFM